MKDGMYLEILRHKHLAAPLLIISHNRLAQNLCSDSTLLRTRVLCRVMAHTILAGDEDHGRRAMLVRVDTIVTSTAR